MISGDAQWVSGFSGSALSFDGNTGRMRVPDSASLDPTTAVTVTAWIRATEPQGDFNYILAKGASGCLAASYGLYTGPNGGLMFYVARNRGLSYTRSPDAGHWRVERKLALRVGTYDGSSVRLYLDGNQVGNGTAHTGPIDYDFPDNDLFIGHYNTCPAEDFHGEVDSAQIYNRALTPSEIRRHVRPAHRNRPGGSPGGTGQDGTSSARPGGGTSRFGGSQRRRRRHAPGASQSDVTVASVSGLSSGKPHLVLRVTASRRDQPDQVLHGQPAAGVALRAEPRAAPQGRLAGSQTEVLAVVAPRSARGRVHAAAAERRADDQRTCARRDVEPCQTGAGDRQVQPHEAVRQEEGPRAEARHAADGR